MLIIHSILKYDYQKYRMMTGGYITKDSESCVYKEMKLNIQ